jgi:hypothetical protein
VGALRLPRILSTILPKSTVWTSLVVSKTETWILFNNEKISTNLLFFFCFDYGNKYLLVDFLNHEKWKKNPKTYNKKKKRNGPSEKLTKQTNESKNKNNKMIKSHKKSLKWAYSILLNSFKVNIGYFLQQVLKPFCFM